MVIKKMKGVNEKINYKSQIMSHKITGEFIL